MPRASLTQRIVLPLGAVVLLLQLGLAAYTLDHERKALLGQLDTRAARLANIRHAFDLHGDELDEKKVATWLGTTLLEQEDVVFCEVIAGEDRTLFREGTPDKQRSRRYAFPIAGQNQPSGGGEATTDNGRAQTAAATGTLYLALSTTDIEQALAKAKGTLAVAILAGTAVALLLATLIVRYTIGNTVAHLIRETRIASLGDLGHSTSSRSHDPFEQLAEMLDAMTAQVHNVVEEERNLTAQMISEQSQHGEAVPQLRGGAFTKR